MAKKKSGGFNWKGIHENRDGTYSAANTPAKRRLLKALHTQGYTVRSTRTETGWKIAAVGTRSQVNRRSAQVGYRPRTRYRAGLKPQLRKYPVVARPVGRMPNPRIVSGPAISKGGLPTSGFFQKAAAQRKERQKQIERTKNIQMHSEATPQKYVPLTKQGEINVKMGHAEQFHLRQDIRNKAIAEGSHTPRTLTTNRQEVKTYYESEYSKPKINRAALEEARENEVT